MNNDNTSAPTPPSEKPIPQEWDECGPIRLPAPAGTPEYGVVLNEQPITPTIATDRANPPAPAPEGREGTPRTDKAVGETTTIALMGCADLFGKVMVVKADFARQLELELTASQSRVAELEKERDRLLIKAEVLEDLREAVFKDDKESNDLGYSAVNRVNRIHAENDSLRAQLTALRDSNADLAEKLGLAHGQIIQLREAGQELAGAMEAIKADVFESGKVSGRNQTRGQSALTNWQQAQQGKGAAPMGREKQK